jgi:hypothetical protein
MVNRTRTPRSRRSTPAARAPAARAPAARAVAQRKGSGRRAGGTRASTRSSRSHAKRSGPRSNEGRFWSDRVTHESNALDLDAGVFTWDDPRRIAASLKRSAERSRRRKTSPFRSAMSMLVFFENRAGRKLPAARRRVLRAARDELRRQFGRED